MAPQPHRVSLTLAGTELSLETGRIAKLASGAVVGRCGDTTILATVVTADSARPDVDFLPLQVEYREKLAAAGRIPGSFNRREGRITDHEVLTSRLIDRTVRSLFPSAYRCEVQIQVNVMSADPAADITSLAIITACAALQCSPVPAAGPAAGLRIVRHDGGWHAFAGQRLRGDAHLDFVVSAGPDGLVMVEGEADEASEEDTVEALEVAQSWLAKVCQAIGKLQAETGVTKAPTPASEELPELPTAVRDELRTALENTQKTARYEAVSRVRDAHLAQVPDDDRAAAGKALDRARYEIVRERILDRSGRLDGRGPEDIRPIWGEVGWLPRPHGSAIFTRGETQALVTCTLGTVDDGQRIEALDGSRREHFLLHYNFPPYSVGEIRPLRGPGRREIGHGFLARRGLTHMVPPFDHFPYTIRIESEITESNGSSSMATVCGSTMAMLHAGVPLRSPVAGIAMGLVSDGERTETLSDILGDEDHLGDMDFKVVGTANGITALQLDNKIGGLSRDQLAQALDQAKRGREHILTAMAEVVDGVAAEPSPHAPRVEKTAIMPSSMGQLVGPRGANIRAIESSTGARVTADDDGMVRIYASDAISASKAMVMVQRAAGVVSAGKYYRAAVTGVRDFGAFAKINEANEGLIPSSELPAERPKEGDEIVIQVLGVDGRGRLRLSATKAAGVDDAQIEY